MYRHIRDTTHTSGNVCISDFNMADEYTHHCKKMDACLKHIKILFYNMFEHAIHRKRNWLPPPHLSLTKVALCEMISHLSHSSFSTPLSSCIIRKLAFASGFTCCSAHFVRIVMLVFYRTQKDFFQFELVVPFLTNKQTIKLFSLI